MAGRAYLAIFHPPSSILASHFALARGFVEENRRGGADVQRIHGGRHGNGHRFVTRFKDRCGNAVAFAPEDDAAIAGEIRLRKRFAIGVRMRRDAMNAAGAKTLQRLRQSLGGANYTSP